MKRMLPIIIGLISLSLIGIVIIQILYLQNMFLLREEQVRQKVYEVTKSVAEDLAQYKGTPSTSSKVPGFGDDFSFELTKPYNVGHRFTAQEIYEKLKVAFAAQDLENLHFEFGLATFNRDVVGYMERQSSNFAEWYEDSSNHHYVNYLLVPPSGSAAENIASNEILIVAVPEIKNIATK